MEWSRREFAKMGVLGLASQAMPGMLAQATGRKVGYCVIGLGRIADHFMRGVKDSSTSQITGLVSGHRDKALRIAAQYGVPESSIYSYEQMDAMRDNKSIDAVYVALPNSMHAEYTIRVSEGGQACAVREADVDERGGCGGDDCGLQGGEREVDDCVPAAL